MAKGERYQLKDCRFCGDPIRTLQIRMYREVSGEMAELEQDLENARRYSKSLRDKSIGETNAA